MTLDVEKWPDSVKLRKVCAPATKLTDTNKIIQDLFDTMYEEGGIGISANQVGYNARIFVTHIKEPKVHINPEIIEGAGMYKEKEGCLSIPGYFDYVKRKKDILVKYYDKEWNEKTERLVDLEATCFQHELDHLNGILFVDHISPLKLPKAKKKVKSWSRKASKFSESRHSVI